MARPGANPRTRFRRLNVTVINLAGVSTASLPTIQVDNRDSGPDGNIFKDRVNNLHTLFQRLGFDVTFNFTQE